MSLSTSTFKTNFFLSSDNLPLSNVCTKFKLSKIDTHLNNMSISFASDAKKSFNLTQDIVWVCNKCGHIHIGGTPTSSCPICNSNYEIKN